MLFTNEDEPPINSRAFQTLARTLPVFRRLVMMHLTLRRDQDVLAIGRSLRAWPLPKLIVNRHPHTNQHASPRQERFNWNLKDYHQTLTLPPGAVDVNVDLICTSLLSPLSHLPPPTSSPPSSPAAREPI